MRWIRLDACFDETWLFTLSAGAQLAWIKLLCTCKRDGLRGEMKALSHVVAARKWGVGEEDVAKMLHAATADGALEIVDGKWVIVNWDRFQELDPTAAERKRRQRERERGSQAYHDESQCHDQSRVTSVTAGVTCRVTETETETVIDTLPNARDDENENPRAEKFQPPTMEDVLAYCPMIPLSEEEGRKFWLHYDSFDWKVEGRQIFNWRSLLGKWKLNGAKYDKSPPGRGQPKQKSAVSLVDAARALGHSGAA